MLLKLSTPLLVTLIVKLLAAPPAVTVGLAKLLVALSTTFSTMSTLSLPDALSSSELASAVLPTAVALSVVVATW